MSDVLIPKLNLQRLLNRTAKSVKKSSGLLDECHTALRDRYGVDYNEIDADTIIDGLEYGCGVTVAEADKEMARLGYEVINEP